jgi:polysaccharide export outer membrane protein
MVNQLLSLAVACVAAGSVIQAQSQRPAATPPPTPPVANVPADYVIGTEDVLGIVFWREPDISGDATVRPDGKITVPVLGEMVAAGLKPEELRQRLQTAASKYINDPNASVVVRTINSRKVFVTGRVTTPGTYDLKGPITVLQAIALAGGVTEYADAKNITVLRTREGQAQVLKFNYRDVSKGKNLEQNIVLQPGDTIVVP